jgi:prepilin peptidase CpaA
MEGWTLQQVLFVIGVVALTGTAAYTDLRRRKIPNWLTLPFFAAGWIYQGAAHGWGGLYDGLIAFALGFGTYFVLWMVAGGGGGDVKLMGAVSVWLGFKLTLYVMIVSTVLVVIDSAVVMLYTIARFGMRRFKKQFLATGKSDAEGRPIFGETEAQRRGRRIIPFAVPLAMAAWLVLLADGTILKGGQLGP